MTPYKLEENIKRKHVQFEDKLYKRLQEGVRCVTAGSSTALSSVQLNSPLILQSSAGNINTAIPKFKACIEIKVTCAVTQCSLVDRYQGSGKTCCFHLQDINKLYKEKC
jgi:hypothetical protein